MPRLILLFIIGLASLAAWADNAAFRFRQIGLPDGLPNNCVRSIAQDERGFVWMGTDEGLCRYDGNEIARYAFCDEDPSHYVSTFLCCGITIYVGSDDGLYVLETSTGRARKVTATATDGFKITSPVTSIARDKEGNIWVATYGQGVFRYVASMEKLLHYTSTGSAMSALLVDSANQIWAASLYDANGLYKLDKSRDVFAKASLRNLSNQGISVVYEDSNHTIWLGTWDKGVYRINPDQSVTPFLAPGPGRGVTHVHAIAEKEPGALLIGSDDGLTVLDTLTGKHQLYTEDDSDQASLSNRFVYSIVTDHAGGMWVGTFFGGANYMPVTAHQFRSYTHSEHSNSVGGNVISRFCEDEDGNVWIASDDGGLSMLSPATGTFDHVSAKHQSSRSTYYNAHALLADGPYVWVGTYGDGVDRYDRRTGQFKSYTHVDDDERTLDNSSSYAIFRDSRGRIWVSTMVGLNLYMPDTDDFTRICTLDVTTIDIEEDVDGSLWLATQGRGIFRYNPERGEWKQYDTKAGIASDHVNSICTDSRGTMWVGTMKGISRYDRSADRFVPLDIALPSHNVCAIVADNDYLWITTAHGMVRYSTANGKKAAYSSLDGLCNDQFVPNSAYKASDGSIYIGSVKGFSRFWPYEVVNGSTAAPIWITGVDVFNDPLEVGSKALPVSTIHLDRLRLPHDSNTLTLRFATLNYELPDNNAYEYMLDGFDRSWVNAASSNKAAYTNIPPGNYTFRVRSIDREGVPSATEAALPITITPPWYLTVWAKIAYVVLALALVALIAWIVMRYVERSRRRDIDKLNASKEHEILEERVRFFTMIAHEIRTPVSLIIGPLEKILTSADKLPTPVQNELNILGRNSQRLLYLVNQLLDFRKIESGGMRMHFARQSVPALVKAVAERFAPTLESKHVKLEVKMPADDFTAIVDAEAVTKALSNLLTNASKYTRSLIVVSCEEHKADGTCSISVADNGIGVSLIERDKIFKPFYQVSDHKPGTGIGLSLVKSIAELHQGRIDLVSEVGRGSTFTIVLPLSQPITEQEAEPDAEEAAIAETVVDMAVDDSRPTMLIVDDNDEMLEFLSNNFGGAYNVITALDGAQALDVLHRHHVDMVVSDWMMPVMDGPALVQALRHDETISHIPVIMLTARTDNVSKIQSMDIGADIFVEKPFSVQYLESCIRNLVEMRRKLKEKFSSTPMVPLSSIATNAADNDFLARLNAVIEENFANPEFNVDQLASELSISRSSLFSKIRSMTDNTPNELIQLMRLKKAAALLREHRYRISEVCYMVGFSNPSYFSKCFAKQFGMTPGDFK